MELFYPLATLQEPFPGPVSLSTSLGVSET